MRVGFFTTSASKQSGATYALTETIQRLRKVGVEPTLIVPSTEECKAIFQGKPWQIHYLDMVRMRSTLSPRTQWAWIRSLSRSFRQIQFILREDKLQLLHINEITDLIGAVAAKKSRIPCVTSVRAGGIPQPAAKILSFLTHWWSDRVVVPSGSIHDFILSNCPPLKEKLLRIPDFAFDISPYDSTISGDAVKGELGIQLDQRVVLLVSKLLLDKGHAVFLRAASRVAVTHPDTVFVIVGGSVEGHEAEAETILRLSQSCVPPSQLRLLGTRSDLPDIFAASDVVVHCPVYPDPYPTVVLLAMLMGKPVIGSEIGGIPEQITDCETGLLVPPGDHEMLGRLITRLLDCPEESKRIGRKGEYWMRAMYSPEQQADQLLAAYQSMVHPHHTRDGRWHTNSPG